MMKLQLIYMTLWTAAHALYPNRMAVMPNLNNLVGGMNLKSNSHPVNQGRLRIAGFRPGVIMRPWSNPRFTPAASHRVPYVLYRNQNSNPRTQSIIAYNDSSLNPEKQPENTVESKSPSKLPRDIKAPQTLINKKRFAVKPYSPGRVYVWKSRLSGPAPATPPPAAPRHHDGGTGAIHTIPAPNLSLSEKPIVVVDDSSYYGATTESQKASYEVTENPQTRAPSLAQIPANIKQPIGFSKTSSLSTPELHSIVQNGGTVHFPNELEISQFGQYPQITQQALQAPVAHQNIISNLLPQNIVAQPFLPQEYRVSNPNDQMIQAGPDGIVISPNALYQPDPDFLQKLQTQLLQRFPGVEFVPYPADVHGPVKPVQSQPQTQLQSQPFAQASQIQQFQQTQPPLFLLQNEQYINPLPIPQGFVALEPQKSLSQRQTQESAVVTLVPQVKNNATEKGPEVVTDARQIVELMASESRPETTTIKFVIETTTEQEKTSSPIYLQFAPVPERSHQTSDQNTNSSDKDEIIEPIKPEHNISREIGSLYSALNDFRAVITLEEESRPRKQVQPLEDTTTTTPTTTTTSTTTTTTPTTTSIPTTTSTVKQYFMPQPNQVFKNQSIIELKPLPGAPFAKSPNSVNVAYTLQASDNKNAKVAKDGSVYAGQIVEGSVSEDQDFNKEKANLLSRRAPVRLPATIDNREAGTASNGTRSVRGHEKITVVKAKIPSKSKLTFDDKTGEPVLRIYASYVGTPSQVNFKDILPIITTEPNTLETTTDLPESALPQNNYNKFQPSFDLLAEYVKQAKPVNSLRPETLVTPFYNRYNPPLVQTSNLEETTVAQPQYSNLSGLYLDDLSSSLYLPAAVNVGKQERLTVAPSYEHSTTPYSLPLEEAATVKAQSSIYFHQTSNTHKDNYKDEPYKSKTYFFKTPQSHKALIEQPLATHTGMADRFDFKTAIHDSSINDYSTVIALMDKREMKTDNVTFLTNITNHALSDNDWKPSFNFPRPLRPKNQGKKVQKENRLMKILMLEQVNSESSTEKLLTKFQEIPINFPNKSNALEKDTITSKLSNTKNAKEVTRKQDNVDSWKGGAVKALAKPFEPNPNNQVTQFGLKLRARSDDYIPLFDDEYEG